MLALAYNGQNLQAASAGSDECTARAACFPVCLRPVINSQMQHPRREAGCNTNLIDVEAWQPGNLMRQGLRLSTPAAAAQSA